MLSFFFLITFLSILLILSNGVELSPGLNSIAAQNFVKLSQLEAYSTLHSYDLICLSETWLNSTTSIDSNDLSLKGYTYIVLTILTMLKMEGFVFIIRKP